VLQGTYDKAIEHFARAEQIDPRWADIPFNHANIYLRQKEFVKAIALYDKSLALRPEFAKARINLAIAESSLAAELAQSNHIDEALPHFARAVEVEPDNPLHRMYYATALGNAGQLSAALEQFHRAAADADRQGNLGLLGEIQSRVHRFSTSTSQPK
jgi:tetratricopeptide (TPR) repeat protein